MIIDGKRVAEEVYARLKTPRPLTLGILIGGASPVIASFVRIKERAAARLGVTLVKEMLLEGATTTDAIAAVESLAEKTDGIIVQLPLSKEIDVEAVLGAIPPEKDVDGISPRAQVRPPVAEAIAEILSQTATQTLDATAVIVGSGRLVGRPAAELLKEMGAHVTVVQRGDSLDVLKGADMVILGAGEPGLVEPAHLKEGVVLIDAGTSEVSGKVAGDADPACAEKASVFTPVPGGVGPLAVAMIFKNLYKLANH